MSSSNNSNTQQKKSPFGGSRFGSSRFSGSSSNNNSNKSSSSSSSRSRFSSRFSRETIEWTVQPFHQSVVRLTLEGLGDPFHRLLGRKIDPDMSKPVKVAELLQQEPSLKEELVDVLNNAWESYEFTGAALLYPSDSHISMAYTKPIYPMPEQETDDDSEDEDQADENPEDAYRSPYECLRAIDVAFVMNVLARTRANVIVADTPLALEAAFLQQTFICDDPRITSIARATGCIGEQWE
jgi:hypothetical protein